MKKKEFIVKIEFPKNTRIIDSYVIKKSIEDYLDSVSGFYYENVEVKSKEEIEKQNMKKWHDVQYF